MPMFDSVLKELEIAPARTADSSAPDVLGRIAKAAGLNQSRTIHKLSKALIVPGNTYPKSYFKSRGILMEQHNYTAPKAFYLLVTAAVTRISIIAVVAPSQYLTIKWIESDGSIKRYSLAGNFVGQGNTHPALYANQLIQPNFTIERWSNGYAGLIDFLPSYPIAGSTFITSILSNPIDASSITDTPVTLVETLTRADLDESLPETLPTQYNDGCNWGTN